MIRCMVPFSEMLIVVVTPSTFRFTSNCEPRWVVVYETTALLRVGAITDRMLALRPVRLNFTTGAASR